MKKGKLKGILYYISAVLYWMAAIFSFLEDKNISLGACFLCLGFSMMLLGKTEANKQKKDEAETKDE